MWDNVLVHSSTTIQSIHSEPRSETRPAHWHFFFLPSLHQVWSFFKTSQSGAKEKVVSCKHSMLLCDPAFFFLSFAYSYVVNVL